MIKDIEISNFRCFEHTKIEGFERVNLIGGKNNSGKTALLETIFLYSDGGDEEPVIIAASVNKSLEELSKSYTKIVFNEQEEEVLKALKIIDPSIEKIESFFLGEPNLYLKRKETKHLPISLFGKAINRLIEMIFALLLNPQKIIFIDEIENGLHYTAYPDI